VVKSAVNDANAGDLHHWEQSESGMVDLVKRCSNKGDIVCDPFCGSGTTGVVAVELDRQFIGADSSKEAIKTTRERFSGR
jgi:site-specific DNA-methyltransferase (adenine-specific)